MHSKTKDFIKHSEIFRTMSDIQNVRNAAPPYKGKVIMMRHVSFQNPKVSFDTVSRNLHPFSKLGLGNSADAINRMSFLNNGGEGE